MARDVSWLTLQSLTVEHVRNALHAFGRVVISDCIIRECWDGLILFTPEGAQITASRFENCIYDGIFSGSNARDVQIAGCEFVGNSPGVSVNRTQNAVVAFCAFEGGGIQYSDGSTGLVQRCTVAGRLGIALTIGASVSLVENRIHASERGLVVMNFSHVTGERNVISGASYATVHFLGSSTADFHGNHILKGAGPLVRVEGYVLDPIEIDLTGNYWGTASADSLSAWILDGNDPHVPWETWNGFVVFQPFTGQPVPSSVQSFGGLKAMYGGVEK